jgi:hypothetical protein
MLGSHEHAGAGASVVVGPDSCQKSAVKRPFAAIVLAIAGAACGSRTGLSVEGDPPTDASIDVRPRRDVAVSPDVSLPRETGPDALPFIEASVVDVKPPGCPADTLVYVLSDRSELFSFHPPSLEFRRIGTLSCPTASTPYSMAVGRDGTGYSVFQSGELFRVDMKTAACSATTYEPGQHGFITFGMAFTVDTDPSRDALYVIEGGSNRLNSPSDGLGRIDLSTMTLDLIGAFRPQQNAGELSGAADGRLFGMHHSALSGGTLTEIDKATAEIVAQTPIAAGGSRSALAFAYWGGSFWIFTGASEGSTITSYDPSTNTERELGTAPALLVGAGVSPCNQ